MATHHCCSWWSWWSDTFATDSHKVITVVMLPSNCSGGLLRWVERIGVLVTCSNAIGCHGPGKLIFVFCWVKVILLFRISFAALSFYTPISNLRHVAYVSVCCNGSKFVCPFVLQGGHHDNKACPLLVVMSLFLNGHKLQNKKHAQLHWQGHVQLSVILWLCNDLCWLVKIPSVVLREKYSSLREKNKELSIWIMFLLQASIPS
jgi:hypothetical protein